MEKIGAYEAKTHFSEIIKRVQCGERVYITHHGTEVAVLSPVEARPVQPIAQVISALKEFQRELSLELSIKALIEEGRS